jgi:hypothetical protein
MRGRRAEEGSGADEGHAAPLGLWQNDQEGDSVRKRFLPATFAALVAAAAVAVGAGTASAAGLCVFPVSSSINGLTATQTFSVASGCGTVQVSLVSISYSTGTAVIYDTATGNFPPGPSYSLTVKIPCGTNGEDDLVLGPPALFPPPPNDVHTIPFNVPCASTGPGTLTIGYWKNHPSAWPVSSLTLGGTTVSESTAIGILQTPPRGDATIILAQQLIAAELNVALGNTSSCISSTISAANALLAAHPVGSGLSPSSSAGQQATSLASTLDAYNNGGLCAPHQS